MAHEEPFTQTHYVWLRGNTLVSTIGQHSCSTPGTVTTWMGDCLLTGKLFQYVPNTPRLKPQPDRLVLDLPTPEGLKAELTYS